MGLLRNQQIRISVPVEESDRKSPVYGWLLVSGKTKPLEQWTVKERKTHTGLQIIYAYLPIRTFTASRHHGGRRTVEEPAGVPPRPTRC
jgi:hypothetical protein